MMTSTTARAGFKDATYAPAGKGQVNEPLLA